MGPVIPGGVAAAGIAASGVLLVSTLYYRARWARARNQLRELREMVRTWQVDPLKPSLEQAIDAIALEVERLSEGQRFLTKLLGERRADLGAARPQQAGLGQRTPTPTP